MNTLPPPYVSPEPQRTREQQAALYFQQKRRRAKNAIVPALSAPVNTTLPSITGQAKVGQTLACNVGYWSGYEPPVYTFQWQRVTTDIVGATNGTYLVAAPDVGSTLRCVVKATNATAPAGVTANSANTAVVIA
jgi:hypothetical protein